MWNGTMFVDLDLPLNASSLLSASAELLVLLCICVVSCPYVIYYPTVMVQYSLLVLKVPLNPKQTNKLSDIFHTPMARYSLFALNVPLTTYQLIN